MPATIHTVLGEIDPERSGSCLPHEHVVFGAENASAWSGELDRAQVIKDAVDDLADCRHRHGLAVMVDLTAIAASRDVELMREIAEQSGVAIVAATGFWEGASYPEWATSADPDELAARFTLELLSGIDGTAYRAGAIKIATARGAITEAEANGLRAAARAQRRTGAPILTHTGLGSMALEQVAIFEQEGADLDRVVVGHLDSVPGSPIVRAVLARGASIAFDRLGRGRPSQPEDAEKAQALAALIRDGFANKIMLSHDSSKWFTVGATKPERPAWSYLFDSFLPRLRGLGVSNSDIELMTERNPRQLLAW